MAQVLMTNAAREEFDGLPLSIRARVAEVFDRLANWPEVSGAKPLSGNLAGQHRIRTGDYRVQFKVEGKGTSAVVTVNKVGHRDGFYE
jgi:mRNA-degrading endonuclease RelE of RelBE toxin-antitoxin system